MPELDPVILPVQVKFPVAFSTVQPVAPDPPARLTLPVEVPAMFTAPVVPALRLISVAAVETEMVGAVEVNVNAVEETFIVSMLATPVREPAVVTLRPQLLVI